MADTGVESNTQAATARPREPSSHAEDARRRLLRTLPVTERRLQIAGISTAVLEGGKGSPVVLLHGPSAYAAHWLQVIPDWSRPIA